MTKKLDWSVIASVNFDDKRRKANGFLTGKEVFAKAYENLAKAEAALAHKKASEPILKAALINHIVNRLPIKVLQPINNPTETVGGLTKSQDDEDDGFYNNSPSRAQEAALNAKFEEVMETIPAGSTLVFKAWDRQLGQWIFKSDRNQEYAIYDKALIMFRGSAIENPGLYGLLYQTSLIEALPDPEEL